MSSLNFSKNQIIGFSFRFRRQLCDQKLIIRTLDTGIELFEVDGINKCHYVVMVDFKQVLWEARLLLWELNLFQTLNM